MMLLKISLSPCAGTMRGKRYRWHGAVMLKMTASAAFEKLPPLWGSSDASRWDGIQTQGSFEERKGVMLVFLLLLLYRAVCFSLGGVIWRAVAAGVLGLSL